MTSFNYGGKKARDVVLTCRYHLRNIVLDSIFNNSMGWGITQFVFVFFFLGVVIAVLLSIEEMDSVLSL